MGSWSGSKLGVRVRVRVRARVRVRVRVGHQRVVAEALGMALRDNLCLGAASGRVGTQERASLG